MKSFYTEFGKKIVSPKKYAKTGAPMYLYDGQQNINKKTVIYILHLEYDKIYIGKTSNFKRRMYQHFNNMGSEVTKKIKPMKGEILCICDGYFSNNLEQHYTTRYIEKYGYCNVRGGSFTNSKTFKKKFEQPRLRF